MGKVNLYLLYDVVAQEFGPTFEAKNDNVARRAVKPLLKENPDDFRLLCVASLDRETGVVLCTDSCWIDLPNLLVIADSEEE